jgi:hypothetical protein
LPGVLSTPNQGGIEGTIADFRDVDSDARRVAGLRKGQFSIWESIDI